MNFYNDYLGLPHQFLKFSILLYFWMFVSAESSDWLPVQQNDQVLLNTYKMSSGYMLYLNCVFNQSSSKQWPFFIFYGNHCPAIELTKLDDRRFESEKKTFPFHIKLPSRQMPDEDFFHFRSLQETRVFITKVQIFPRFQNLLHIMLTNQKFSLSGNHLPEKVVFVDNVSSKLATRLLQEEG